jgi:hypothetical protein
MRSGGSTCSIRRYNPAFFHNSSTRRFTSADISGTEIEDKFVPEFRPRESNGGAFRLCFFPSQFSFRTRLPQPDRKGGEGSALG